MRLAGRTKRKDYNKGKKKFLREKTFSISISRFGYGVFSSVSQIYHDFWPKVNIVF